MGNLFRTRLREHSLTTPGDLLDLIAVARRPTSVMSIGHISAFAQSIGISKNCYKPIDHISIAERL
ncbi:hypothetical protein OKW35_006724 [Paraburkholderia sp. MM5477-R1]